VAPPRPSPPPPLEGDNRLITIVITAGWAAALAGVLIAYGSIPQHDRWWLWTCVTGVVLGFFGLWYVPRLQRSRALAAGRRAGRQAGQAGRTGLPGPAGQLPLENDSKTVSSSETPGRSTRS
jgi:hypothetical protein